jgi:uncharacterized protein (TIGR02145 family)
MKKHCSTGIYFLLIIFCVTLTDSCKKDDNGTSGNQTIGHTKAVFNPNKTYGTVTDIEGNVYKTITIGTQTWMAENLRTTTYNDGTIIAEVTDKTAWKNIRTSAYCNYNNTKNGDTIATYGRLYNIYAISDSRNLAPEGWHISTPTEWFELGIYLVENGYNFAGLTSGNEIAKALASTNGWNSNTTTGSIGNSDFPLYRNKSGFTAMASGFRSDDGVFYESGISCNWFSFIPGVCYIYNLRFDHVGVDQINWEMRSGFSVRCVKN